MRSENRRDPQTETRRRFLRTAGLGAAASLTAILPGSRAIARGEPRKSDTRVKRPLELGVASYTFRKFGLDEALVMTRRVGLSNICLKSFHLPLDSGPREIANVVRKTEDAGIKLYGGGVIPMRNEAQVHRAFEYAKSAGMKTIVGVPRPDLLPLVNDKVRQYNISVAIHNHGPGDKTYPTPQSAYEKIKGLDGRIGLCMDVGHTVRIGADPFRSAELYSDRLLDVHIKDVSAAAPKGKEIEVGRGVIDIPRLLQTLLKVSFSGVVAFEYEKDANDPLAGLAESVGFVKGALAAI